MFTQCSLAKKKIFNDLLIEFSQVTVANQDDEMRSKFGPRLSAFARSGEQTETLLWRAR